MWPLMLFNGKFPLYEHLTVPSSNDIRITDEFFEWISDRFCAQCARKGNLEILKSYYSLKKSSAEAMYADLFI